MNHPSATVARLVAALSALSLILLPVGCASEDITDNESEVVDRDREDGAGADEVGQTGEELKSAVSCSKQKQTAYRNGNAYTISTITVGGKPVSLATGHAFLRMQRAAHEAGVYLSISSGFRTMAEQKYLYGCYLSGRCNGGNLAAKPGYSNHQSGVALDLSTSTWLANNAGRFGFKRTVPSESWHYEYFGNDPGGVCSEGAKEAADLRFTSPHDEGVYHNDGLTFRTTDKSGDTRKVVYEAGNTRLGSSTDRKEGFPVEYTFKHLGNRRITATSFDAKGKKIDTANLDVEMTPPAKDTDPNFQTKGACYARCCNDFLTKDLGATDGKVCYKDAQNACENRGHVRRIAQGGAEVWAREDTCWVKCKEREEYVPLSGVTKDCTDQGRDFCEAEDRGGLGDATWNACNPN